MEFSGEVDSASLPVAEKLQFEVIVRSPWEEHLLHESGRDGAIKPAEDDTVHLCPVGVIGARYVGEDMVLKGIFAERDEGEAAPVRVVVRVEIKSDGDERLQRLHIEDSDGLAVEGGDIVGVSPPSTADGGTTTSCGGADGAVSVLMPRRARRAKTQVEGVPELSEEKPAEARRRG
uniref:Uncharacterized protein n=1 Tax=Oryza brachyantha TaxID=4533 RepID=J3L066_ORYBR